MVLTNYYGNEIHTTLKKLIETKSKRDGINFTIYKLAQALQMPHSILIKLMHQDPSKRVNNPRIDTLTKIVEFFHADGFNITIDDLLMGVDVSHIVDVKDQNIGSFTIEKTIPVYSFESADVLKKVGTTDIKLATDSENLIAFVSDVDIKPIFKKGSIFIVDTELAPENDALVATRLNEISNRIVIKKYSTQDSKIILKDLNNENEPIKITQLTQSLILGVVIQVSAKT